MKYAMYLPGGPANTIGDWTQKIEAAGFDSLWHAEFANSALVPLAAAAALSKQIKLGAGVVLAFDHSPVMLAFAALDLDLVSNGRFILGLGVGSQSRNLNWYAGNDAGKPVSQMREYVEVLRLIMRAAGEGGEVDFSGHFYRVHAKNFPSRSSRQPRPQVPIYMGAVKPKMVELAGETGDGLIGNPLFSPQHLREVIIPSLGTGLEARGRARKDVEVLGQCFAVIEDDLAAAYRIAAGAMVSNILAKTFDDIFAAHGFAETVARVRSLEHGSELSEAIDLIPREVIDAFCAVGPPDRVRTKVAQRDGMLNTVILAVPSTGTTREQQDFYRNRLLEVFAA